MLYRVHWKPKSASIVDFRPQLLKVRCDALYLKMIFPEHSNRLESVLAWSLKRIVGIYRNIFRHTSSIFIRLNYWFTVARRFYLTGGMTNLYSFYRGSLEWPFSEIFLSNASLWNQYKLIAFNIFSCTIFIIYCKILIITVISNKTTNELTI